MVLVPWFFGTKTVSDIVVAQAHELAVLKEELAAQEALRARERDLKKTAEEEQRRTADNLLGQKRTCERDTKHMTGLRRREKSAARERQTPKDGGNRDRKAQRRTSTAKRPGRPRRPRSPLDQPEAEAKEK